MREEMIVEKVHATREVVGPFVLWAANRQGSHRVPRRWIWNQTTSLHASASVGVGMCGTHRKSELSRVGAGGVSWREPSALGAPETFDGVADTLTQLVFLAEFILHRANGTLMRLGRRTLGELARATVAVAVVVAARETVGRIGTPIFLAVARVPTRAFPISRARAVVRALCKICATES